MKLLLDMDGILADFCTAAHRVHNIPYTYDDPANHGNWDFHKLAGLSGNQFYAAFDAGFWAMLPWMHDGRQILDWCERKFGQSNICLLTAAPKTNRGACIDGKMEWIEQHIPAYREQVLFGKAKEFCAHDNAILIDDKESNCRAFEAERGRAYLYPRLWNKHHPIADVAYIDMVRRLAGI